MSDTRRWAKPRVKQGEAAAGPCDPAFRDLFERFAPRVVGYFERHGVAPQECRRLAHVVLAALWNRVRDNAGPSAPVGAWAFAIARDTYLEAVAKCPHPKPDPDDPCFVSPTPPASDDEAPGGGLGRVDLGEALERLPQSQRAILRALYCEGLTLAELARTMQRPLSSLEAETRQALQALRHGPGEGRA